MTSLLTSMIKTKINKREDTIEKLFNWFQCNNFQVYASKYHCFLSSYRPVTIKTRKSSKTFGCDYRQQIVI